MSKHRAITRTSTCERVARRRCRTPSSRAAFVDSFVHIKESLASFSQASNTTLSHSESLPKYRGMTASLHGLTRVSCSSVNLHVYPRELELSHRTGARGFRILTPYKGPTVEQLGTEWHWDSREVTYRVSEGRCCHGPGHFW